MPAKKDQKTSEKSLPVVTLRRLYRDSWAVVEIESGRVVQIFVGAVGETSAKIMIREFNGDDEEVLKDGLPDDHGFEAAAEHHEHERGFAADADQHGG